MSIEILKSSSFICNQLKELLIAAFLEFACLFYAVEDFHKRAKLFPAALCIQIRDFDVLAYIAPFFDAYTKRAAVKNHCVTRGNYSVFQNQRPNLLVGGFLKPNPCCGVCIESLLETCYVLTAVTDLFSKLRQRTVFKRCQIILHSFTSLLFGHDAVQIFSQIGIANTDPSNIRGYFVVRPTVRTAIVGKGCI